MAQSPDCSQAPLSYLALFLFIQFSYRELFLSSDPNFVCIILILNFYYMTTGKMVKDFESTKNVLHNIRKVI